MNVIILGPQGSGKGTQAQLLVQKMGLIHLEMGKILRSVALENNNQYAKIVSGTINKGELVPDEYVRLIAWDFINKHNAKNNGFLLEGYPRTLAQYEQVEDMFRKFGKRIDWVINIEISERETIGRLSSRRTCEKCGSVFNLITNPPKNADKCDVCGGRLVQRDDDQPEAIKRRLQIYRGQTQPVFEKAKELGIGIEIDGERPIEVIHEEILSKLI